MNQAIQRLPKAEEAALVELACAKGLQRSDFACLMTRQQDAGTGRWKRGRFAGETYAISYDLMLCEYCGNLMPSAICPAKVQKIKERLLLD